MEINPSVFKEYDIRGLAGSELDKKTMNCLGKAIGTFLQKKSGKKIVVGHDSRKSSPLFAKSLAQGLESTGAEVTFAGLCTTPMVYFAVCTKGFDGGVQVTASHNPPEFNGIKITEKSAFPVFGNDLQEIRKICQTEKFLTGKGTLSKKSFLKEYKKMLGEKIVLPGKKKLKVVVDTGNGTAGIVAPDVLRAWGLRVVEQHTKLDSNFPHHLPDPTVPENVKDLVERVKKEKADLGLGFDGDCDRLGVVSGSGKMVFADKIIAVLSQGFLEKNKGEKVLCDIKCSKLVEDTVKEYGGELVWGKTGHSLIKSKMRSEKILFAGEMSGHVFFKDEFFGFDDGMYTAGRLLRLLHEKNASLDAILGEMPEYFNTEEIRVDVEDAVKDEIVNEVKKFFLKKYPASQTIDGIRVELEGGWALVRKSNTQSKLILRFEAESMQRLDEIKAEVVQKLNEFPGLKGLEI